MIDTPQVSLWSRLTAAVEGARWVQVMALYADMQQRELRPNAVVYGTLVHAAGHVGRWEQALELVAEAAGRGIPLDVQGYTAAIDACAANFQVRWWSSDSAHTQTLGTSWSKAYKETLRCC